MRILKSRALWTAWMLSVLLLPVLAGATTYYVDDGGNDANNGLSASAPWKTITHATAVISGGTAAEPDVLMVAAGTYGTANGETFPIVFNGNNIHVIGAGAASVIIDTSSTALRFNGTGYRVSGFTFRNAATGAAFSRGGFTVADNVFASTVTRGVTFIRSDTGINSNVHYGDMVISGNTFRTSTSGVEVEILQQFDGVTANLTATIGNMSVTGNTFSVAGGKAVTISNFNLTALVDGTATVGRFTVSNNTFTGGDYGIFLETATYTGFRDSRLTTGGVLISGNRFTNQAAEAVWLGAQVAYNITGRSALSFGDLTTHANTINSDTIANPGCKGIYISMSTVTQIKDQSRVNLPAVTVTNNDIVVDDLALFHGGTLASSIGQQYWNDSATVTVGATSISGNTLTSVTGPGIHIQNSAAVTIYGRSTLTLGALSITGNTVLSDGAACTLNYISCGSNMHDDSVLQVQGVTITNNTFTSANDTALSITQSNIAAGLSGNASVSVKPLAVGNNTMTTSNDGIMYQFVGAGTNMQDKASLSKGSVRIYQNTIQAATAAGLSGGITVSNSSVGTNNQGPVSITVEDISITDNTISDAGSLAVYVLYSGIGSSNVGAGQVSVGDTNISDNNLHTVGMGTYVMLAGVNTDSGASVTVGKLDINGNTITDVSQNGLYAYYQAQNNNPGIASLAIGAVSIDDNSISGTPSSAGGILLVADIPAPGVAFGKKNLSGNSVNGFQYGIILGNNVKAAGLRCNIVEHNAIAGLAISSNEPFTATHNAFVGNGKGLMITGGRTAVVSAEKNWWGDAAGPAACTSCNKIDPGGGSVDYTPWLLDISQMQCSRFPWPMFIPAFTGGRL